MSEVNPRIRLRWRHPTELSWHRLHGMLFHVGQHEERLVSDRQLPARWATSSSRGIGTSLPR